MSSNTSTISAVGKRTTVSSRPYTTIGTRSRPRTAATSNGSENELICAISESRGMSPVVGLSFVNLSTSEAVLCQFADTQTYARTCHKIYVFGPSEIIYMSTAEDSKLLSIVKENLDIENSGMLMTSIDRRYWSESTGYEYIQHLAFPDDLESLKMALGGNYFAACCFAAVVKYIELGMGRTFATHSVRIKFETSEGAMMIDLSTTASLELIQNLHDAKSKHCLFGILNDTMTSMGTRYLRSNILQPSTDANKLQKRYDAVEELTTTEDMFFAVRQALTNFVDTDKVLASLVVLPTRPTFEHAEQSVNNILILKTFVDGIRPICQALAGARSAELQQIQQLCALENYEDVVSLIAATLNTDVAYARAPVELRNQRAYAVQAGVNPFLDVARQTYKEANNDAYQLSEALKEQHHMAFELKYDPARHFFIRLSASELEDRQIPDVFINVFRRKNVFECQTLDLLKLNQKITDAHNEIINMSDSTVQALINDVRSRIHPLFKISESIAMLDMLFAFAQLATTREYVKPELTQTLAIKAGRHPIHEKIHQDKFIPNDVYATQQNRFQIITGCNMSGKSTYIRSIALMVVMAQIGSFIPAEYASLPIIHQLFARVSTDDNIEANVSTFAAEMREIAFILHNVEPRSLIIIDELGRGTSVNEGQAIAVAVAEALIQSKAFVWFVTHFRDVARILEHRAGVVSLYLAVDIADDLSKLQMRYKVSDGYEQQKYYGLALGRLLGLPDQVMETATRVSEELNDHNEAQKADPKVVLLARKRKLVLNLREQLLQAKHNSMDDVALSAWLQKLQREFAMRMQSLQNDLTTAASTAYEQNVEDEEDDAGSAARTGVYGVSEDQLDKGLTEHQADPPTPCSINTDKLVAQARGTSITTRQSITRDQTPERSELGYRMIGSDR